jgi:hypothetical protein
VRRRWLPCLIFAAYALTTIIVTLHHEPWRDEADSWLAARDLPLTALFGWSRHAGTPLLWYAVLFPLARFGGSIFFAQSIVHLMIALAAAAIFLARSPFPATTKALFLFSFYPAYEYAVIARSYALGILLTFALLAIHPTRERHLFAYAAIVVLLFNVNAHSIGVAGGAMLLFAITTISRHRREVRYWLALAMMSGGLLLSFLQLYWPGYLIPPTVVSAPWYGAFPEAASRALIPSLSNEWTRLWAIVFLFVVIIAVRKSTDALLLLICSCTALALIFTYLWVAGYRHYGLVLVAVVASLWLAGDTTGGVAGPVLLMLNLSLLASLPPMIQFAWSDLRANFSGSKEMARYVSEHGLAAEEIAAHPPAQCEAVLAQLPRRQLWYAALGEYGSYMKWDRAYRIGQMTGVETAAGASGQHFGNHAGLFLSALPLQNPSRFGMTLLYATHEPLMAKIDAAPGPTDERYWLYRFKR